MSSSSDLSDGQKKEYNYCVTTAKELLGKQDHHKALQHYQKAYKLYPSEKLELKICKLMDKLDVKSEGADAPRLQEVSDNKRSCPFTPVRSREKRQSPLIDRKNEEGKENVLSMPEETAQAAGEPLADDVPTLKSRAKQAVNEGNVRLALLCYRKAYALQPSEILERRMQRMQTFLDDQVDVTAEVRGCDSVADNVKAEFREETKADMSAGSMELTKPDMSAGYMENTRPDTSACSIEDTKPDISADNMEETKPYISAGNMEETKLDKSAESSGKSESTLSRDSESCSTAPSSYSPSVISNSTALISSTPKVPMVAAADSLSDEQIAIYNSLLSQAKVDVRMGDFQKAVSLYEQAYNIQHSDKLLSKINKLKMVEAKEVVADKSVEQLDIDAHYTELVTRGRQLVEQENLQGALAVYQDAYGVKPSDKLQRKIERIKEYMRQQSQTSDQSQESSGRSMNTDREQSSASNGSADEELYNKHIVSAKAHVKDGNVREALTSYELAAKIRPSAKLHAKIKKLKEYLESNEEEELAEFALVGNGFYLHQDLYSKLYPHQKEGLLWLWGLHKKRKGGILADDMGLGKTIQIISFLSGLFDAEEVKTVIIVMPLSLIENWKKEFDKWAPGIQVQVYHGGSQRERARCTAKIQRRGGVLLTSYGMMVSAAELIARKDGESFGREYKYDYVILDEGHKIKNPTKTSKGVHMIAAQHRIILTGTPIQNNLKEMWALFDWTHHGMLLGTARTFQMEYNKPITRAREKCATYGERRLGEQMADSLKRIIAPFLLRRTKAEVKAGAKARGHDGVITDGPEMPNLTRKNDFVVWCYLSELQKTIYESFTQQDEIKELLNTSKSPLTALVVLKKICDHPRLMSLNQCHKLGLFTPQETEGAGEAEMKDCAANTIRSVADDILMEESGKLQFLVQLMARLKQDGHRTLIFSLSRKMLDIIQKVLSNRGHNIIRMDGTITDLTEREKCVSKFQKNDSYDVFLLTTQVGGVGLTLTAADRVVIFDPSWNPATDSQAVDRAFRIGQQKNVCIYRFISCGTIEEKIYRRQVFKDSVNRQTMQKDDKNLFRYFSNTELYELFQLDNTRVSKTQQQLDQMHSHQRVTDTALDEHIAFLYSCDMYGLSDHDLMFSKEDEEVEGNENREYIEGRVTKAMELLSRESELQGKVNEEEGKYIPGHLHSLPKNIVKPPQYQEEPTTSSVERLIPEYDYSATSSATNHMLAANDWRTHAANDSDVMEVLTSTLQEPQQGGVSSNEKGQLDTSDQVAERQLDTSGQVAEGQLDTSDQVAEGQLDTSNQVIEDVTGLLSPDGSFATALGDMSFEHAQSKTSLNMSLDGTPSNAPNNMPHYDGEQSSNSSKMEEQVLVEDSDEYDVDSKVVLDNSIQEIEESQTDSVLGDDFSQLPDDFMAKDSSEEIGASYTTNHKRRSTAMMPMPSIDASDDDGEVSS